MDNGVRIVFNPIKKTRCLNKGAQKVKVNDVSANEYLEIISCKEKAGK
jgi:hypothetical protein